MITREKLLHAKPASWHVVILAVSVVLLLAAGATYLYWLIFHNQGLLYGQRPAEPPRGAYVYPRYKLDNVIKQKVFGPSVDVSR